MIATHDEQTIIAQCTPQGAGALALLRISGPDALALASAMSKLPGNKPLVDVPTHTIWYGSVMDAADVHIDNVMFIVMHGPKTFTGQNVVEITCHNNQFIIQAIMQRAINLGARLAQPGEFAKRAVLNNKIDLVQAEAINELIHANTQLALQKSLQQVDGSFSAALQEIQDNLLKALAFSQASFEFIDEEMTFEQQIHQLIAATSTTIEQIKQTFDQQAHIRQGIRIAIIGSVNAGKSSLFNALLNKERAIVTHIAGTTRDVLEAGVYKDGNYWTLIDTAGLRTTDDVIEQEGIRRSYAQAQQADIILLVVDGSRHLTTQETEIYQHLLQTYPHKIIVIKNKSDLPAVENELIVDAHRVIGASSDDKHALATIEDAIKDAIDNLFAAIESPFLLNKRQFNLLLAAQQKLTTITTMLAGPVAFEILSYHLTDVLADLGELTGKTISEQGLDAVFREFCVGK